VEVTDHAVLRGADVVDGTGSPATRVDVAIADGRIVAVGPDQPDDFPTVDLSGLVLAPGFVDPHTHYDAQVFWDPGLTPSSWHGVTTVVMGNCGFTVAPTRPEHREVVVRTLENVEGMSADALRAGLPWSFETFPDYVAAIDALPLRLNVANLIGHTALRWYVLGDDAPDREATPSEIDRMCALVREALSHGAVGLSTSFHNHIGAFGKPVPSRAASFDELSRLAGVLGDYGTGSIEIAIGGGVGIDEARALAQDTGRPVTWSGTPLMPAPGEDPRAAEDAVDAATRGGAPVFPQFPCRAIVNQVTLRDPFPLRSASEAFLEIFRTDPADRLALYRDERWRQRAKAQLQPAWAARLATATVEETEVHRDLRNGPTLGELAEREGTTPFDVLVDLSVADGLDTRFRVAVANTNEGAIELLLADRRCLLGLSDGGAHVSQLCDANYATYLLAHWVRERGVLPLELAVWRLTGQPASFYGLHDRGRIAVGAAADLVAFDPARVGTADAERVWDFPDGTDRLVARSTGIERVWVNGVPVRSGGQELAGVAPGRRLSSRATAA
jgi:N-acyl-D-aspartate/D-glutamate deacylase